MTAFDHCMNCEKRYPGCHAKCELYKADKAEWDRKKALENRDKEYFQYFSSQCGKGKDAAVKHRNKVKDIVKFHK